MDSNRVPAKYWNEVGKRAYQELKPSLKVNEEMKAAAQKAVAGASNDGEKAIALLRLIRQSVRGLS